jgi:hypothetical protein
MRYVMEREVIRSHLEGKEKLQGLQNQGTNSTNASQAELGCMTNPQGVEAL